jgi:hypothetical protein
MFAGNPLECASHACAFMVTKLKHGCHARGMISNPYLFWMTRPLSQAVLLTAQWSLLPNVIAMHFTKLTYLEPDMQAHVFCEPLMYFEPHPYFACRMPPSCRCE